MDFSVSQVQTSSLKEAGNCLYEAGQTLSGKNLRRSSWLEIAQAIQNGGRLADILLARLQAARTRDDALRVLRIARKAVSRKKRHQTRQAKAATVPSPAAVLQAYAEDQFWGADDWIDDWEEYDLYPGEATHDEYLEWQAGQRLEFSASELRLPGVLPVSALQSLIVEFAYIRKTVAPNQPRSLGQAVGEVAYQQLLTLGQSSSWPTLEMFGDAERAFFSQYGLTRLLDFIDQPLPFFQTRPAPVVSGTELAGLILIEARAAHPFPVDWERIAAWLRAKLSQPPKADREVIVRSFYKLSTSAPDAVVESLVQTVNQMHPAWSSLLLYIWSRRQSLPLLQGRALPPPRYARLTWEDLLISGQGSSLVLHQLRQNYTDIFIDGIQIKPVYESQALNLLLAGAGTLRRMDYPSFSLTCRPGVTLIGFSTLVGLIILANELQGFHANVSRAGTEAVVKLVSDRYQEIQGISLPTVTCQEIISTFERHVIGYILLKTTVLHSQLAQTPFRLRRKHIRRFWADHTAGQLGDLAVPQTLAELRHDHTPDLIIEGLAHALLDYLHHTWPFVGDQVIVLKEEFIFALRLLAMVYTMEPPLRPWPAIPVTEADLDRADDLVDFLLKQIKHAPLELAQALLLPPPQGLPLLNGGQETELERRFQRLLREVTGGTVGVQPDSNISQHYTCRPISKMAALDRGTLGGDCSSQSVPLRALSPHHVYYGVFAGEVQQRGYLTVYEAWAETEEGERMPVLCLETINLLRSDFNPVQQDLLLIFEAIAKSRGLYPGLVLITGIGTWNYQNGEFLSRSRRFRQGQPVRLEPADPVHWQLYDRLTAEADYYNAFKYGDTAWGFSHRRDPFRLLAPFKADLDQVQPENLAEAQRLEALPVRKLIVTARSEQQEVVGFISQLPVVL